MRRAKAGKFSIRTGQVPGKGAGTGAATTAACLIAIFKLSQGHLLSKRRLCTLSDSGRQVARFQRKAQFAVSQPQLRLEA